MIVSLIGLGEEIDEIKTDNNKKFIYRQEFEYFKTRIDRVIGQFGYGVDLILNFFLTRLATKIDINDDKRDELICKYFDESVRLLEKIDNKSVYRKIGFAIYHEYANYLKRRQIDKKYKEFIKKGDTKKAIELLDKSNNILPTVHTLRGYKKMYEKGLISDDKISNVYDSSKMLVFKYDYLSKIKTKYKCLFYKAVFSYYLGKKGYKKDFDFILQGKEKYMEMIMTQYGKSNYNSYAKKYDELCNKVNNFMKEHNIN